ncbi:MAG: hypothetical protein QXY96_07125 [Candidatus Methanomethylicaceae archaeon]
MFFKGIIWREYQKMVTPLGPAKFDYSITEDEAKYLLSKFPKALLVRWTDGFNNQVKSKEWYAVISDKFLDLDEIDSKNRSEIRRGLKNCIVERVDAKLIAERGYDVFISAFERYKGTKKPTITREDFKKRVLIFKDFEDIVHYWGVFYKKELIAYSENYIYDNIEASYSTIKFHPDYLKLYPSYALIYTMNKYYLKDNRFEYVNDGFRNILHQTNIQKYLIDKFKFEKRYTNLYIHYKSYLSIYLSQNYVPYKKNSFQIASSVICPIQYGRY